MPTPPSPQQIKSKVVAWMGELLGLTQQDPAPETAAAARKGRRQQAAGL